MADDDDDGGGGDGWLVSYADLMTLLFATFVVLYGIKPEGTTVAYLGVASSIREAFQDVPEDIPTESKRGPIILGVDVFKFSKGNTHYTPVVQKKAKTRFALNLVNSDMDRIFFSFDFFLAELPKIQKLLKMICFAIVERLDPAQS